MKTLKVLSIIGIIIFSICILIIIVSLSEHDEDIAAVWGFLGMLYGLSYAIVGLIHSNKAGTPVIESAVQSPIAVQLKELVRLRDEGILDVEEFIAEKTRVLARK